MKWLISGCPCAVGTGRGHLPRLLRVATQALGTPQGRGSGVGWVWGGLGLDRRVREPSGAEKLEPPAAERGLGAGAWPRALTAELQP